MDYGARSLRPRCMSRSLLPALGACRRRNYVYDNRQFLFQKGDYATRTQMTLSDEQRDQLRGVARSTSLPHGLSCEPA